MAIEIKAPAFPESVADGEIATWHKEEGDAVTRDELIVEIETDKVVMEVVAPEDGVITKIHAQEGDTIESEQLAGDSGAGCSGLAALRSARPLRPRHSRQAERDLGATRAGSAAAS